MRAIWRSSNRGSRRFNLLSRPAIEWLFEWGYPRPLDEFDLHPKTRWIALGDDIVFWYYLIEDSCFVHICTKPGSHFVFDVRRWLAVVEFLAQVAGAKRLRARPSCNPGDEVAGYLARLGWEPDPETGEGAMQRWV